MLERTIMLTNSPPFLKPSLRKIAARGATALMLALGVASVSLIGAMPASAQRGGWHGGGVAWRGGGGGWHGGGGGWHGGGVAWHGGGWYGGWGAPAAAGAIGGLALGTAIGAAAAQSNAYYGYGGYGGCYPQRQAIYNTAGYMIGYRTVSVCR